MTRNIQRRARNSGALATRIVLAFTLALSRADAAEDPQGLEEVVVTATKRDELLKEVPISISAYDTETMDRIGARDLKDIIAVTPGVEYSLDTGARKIVTIRGMFSRAGSASAGIYIDDVPIQLRIGILDLVGIGPPKIFDIDRVEVLRGPQGTLFGAGAQSGAIRFVSAQPSLTESSGYSRADISSTDGGELGYEAGVSLGGPIVENEVGYRFSAWYRRDGGYIDHESSVPGGAMENDANRSDSVVVRGAMTFAPNESLRITPSVIYQKVDIEDSGFFDPSGSNPGGGEFRNLNALMTPVDDKFFLPSLKVEADIGATTLTSLTGYMQRDDVYQLDFTHFWLWPWFEDGLPPIDVPLTTEFLQPVPYENHQKVFTQELRLQSNDPEAKLKWTTGLYYSKLKQDVHEATPSPQLDALLQQYWGCGLIDCLGGPLFEDVYTFARWNNMRDEQIAAFGQIDYRLSDKFTVIAGARYSRLKSSFTDRLEGQLSFVGPPSSSAGEQEESVVTPKIGINYEPNDNNLFYASAAKGHRMGGGNASQIPTPDCLEALNELGASGTPGAYDSDEMWMYEIGSKNRMFNNRLAIDASVYYGNWDGVQQYIYVPACVSGFVANIGGAKTEGFDLVLNASVTDNLHLGLNVGYTNAESSRTTTGQNPAVPFIYKGDQLYIYGYKWLFAASFEYAFKVSDNDAYVRLDDQYHPKNNGPFTNLDHPGDIGQTTIFQPNPSYNMLNLRAGIGIGGMEWSIYVNNVGNVHPFMYDLSALGVGGSAVGSTFTVRPRTIGAGWIYRW